MNTPDEKTIEDIKAKVAPRELHLLEAEDADVPALLVTSPTKAEWAKFLSETRDENKRDHAQENLVLACTHYPERKEVQALFASKPAAVIGFAEQITKLAGLGLQVRAKKL